MSQIEHADFTPSAPNFKELVFMNMQQLTNFPYIEKDFDALTDYGLLCKVVDYLNTVISNNNEQNALMVALRDAYIELQNYVNDYFDTLDVQEEIDNKLEDMAQSGELTALIKGYIDPIYQSYENEINSEIEIINNKVNSAVSGSPLVASSTAGMTDTTRIYVNTTDGHWYWYDGDSWEDGGVYQSTGIGVGEVIFSNLDNYLKRNLSRIPTYTENTGHYINANSSISNSSNYFYTSPIFIRKGEVITFKTYTLTNMSDLTTCDENVANNTRTAIKIPEEDGYHYVTWKAPQDCYIVLTSRNNDLTELRIFVDEEDTSKSNHTNDLTDKILIENITPELTTGRYVNKSNMNFSNQSIYCTSNAIRLKKYDKISFSAAASSPVAVLSECSEEATPIQLILDNDDYSGIKNYSYTATSDMYVMISCITSTLLNVVIVHDVVKQMSEISTSNLKHTNILSMFSNITCIGDSLTYSQVYISNTSPTSRQAYVTYPMNLEKKTGTPTTNLAHSGDTASQAWERFGGDIVQKTNQLTIIYLGTNYGLTDTMNTDVVGDDYNNYADTNTGNYAKLIKKSLDVGSKVVLVKIYANVSHKPTTNSVIEQMAERFNVAYVENPRLENMVYHYYPDKSGYNTLHYNDLGYEAFTEQLINNISNMSNTFLERIYPS